jgi:hypothetical protein
MAGAVRVSGLRELQIGLKKADAELGRNLRTTLKAVAEPVRLDAERLAVSQIRNMTPRWAMMRTGGTNNVIYVAPKSHRRRGSPRPNLAMLLVDRALDPALDHNEPVVVAGIELMLDNLISRNL